MTQDTTVAAQPRIEVEPRRSPIDAPVSVRVTGLPPGEHVSIEARMTDPRGQRWASHATFIADASGAIDLAATAPLSGTWAEADPMGLFWSMERDPSGPAVAPVPLAGLAPLSVEVRTEVGGDVMASTAIERLVLPDGVTVQDVREDQLVGQFFRPAGPGTYPAVLVFTGSRGGLHPEEAAVLAGHGFATLALAYFGIDPLPRELVNIPLEYFDAALDWVERQPGVRSDRLGAMGSSRGGELALLLGATFPRIRAVAALVPGHVMQAGVEAGGGAGQPSWAHRGQPLPFVSRAPLAPTPEQQAGMGDPIDTTPWFMEAMRDDEAVERAAIPVERINGPVLMVSGAADTMWPGTWMAERVMERLRAHGHPFPFTHLACEEAGHLVAAPPGLPATVAEALHPVRKLRFSFGGTPAGTARGRAHAWPRVVQFLHESLNG